MHSRSRSSGTPATRLAGDATRESRPSSDQTLIGIIGGGITGLALGHYLAALDVSHTVFETSPDPGGVIGSVEREGVFKECVAAIRMAKILGALSIAAGVFAGGDSDASRAARDAAIIGGQMAIMSGIGKSKEAKIHREALGMTAGNFRVAMHRLRKAYRKLLEDEVAHTLQSDEASEVNSEPPASPRADELDSAVCW